jgi:hypothetical protein
MLHDTAESQLADSGAEAGLLITQAGDSMKQEPAMSLEGFQEIGPFVARHPGHPNSWTYS